MKLELIKPLAFFDVETTGTNIGSDRIIEIAIVKILPNGEKQQKRKLINPEMPIPADATAVHGITNEMVAAAPTFKQVANEIKQFLDNCDLAGYNSNRFDVPILVEEFLRVGIDFSMNQRKLVDVQKIFHLMEQRTLSAAYKFYCNKELTNAHSAEADATATFEVLEAQLEKYPQIKNDVDGIIQFTGEEKIVDFARRFVYDKNEIVFNFGKHKGKSVKQVLKEEPQYYDWMMKGDFALHTKQKISEILNSTFLSK